MKVLCILGSARKRGNTAAVLGWVEGELRANGHEVERVDVASKDVRGCIGCMRCKQDPDELFCPIADDAQDIFRRMIESDAVIYATPLYCWGFSAQLKLLIDRHICLVTGYEDPATAKSLVAGKRMALLVTCEESAGEGNTDTLSTIFGRLMEYLQAGSVAELIIPDCTEPDALGDEQEQQARALAAQVVG